LAHLHRWRELSVLRETDRESLVARYVSDQRRQWLDGVRTRGECALRREVNLLGSGPLLLGNIIPWRTDLKTGYEWPLKPSGRLEYSLLHLPCDIKVPWELSRFQHLYPLAQYWTVFRDQRAPLEFKEQIESWSAGNPVGLGPNWACTMDVALRAYSLVWLAAAFSDSEALGGEFWEQFLRVIWQHGEWIAAHLEVGAVNGNHYIADALGALTCGAFFDRTAQGLRWFDLGRGILESEIVQQIEADGTDIEASVPYQRLVMEIFVAGKLLLDRNSVVASDRFNRRLEKAFEFVYAYITPEGKIPIIGDADDGRVFAFGNQDVNDHRYLLAIGCVLFNRSDWKARVGNASVEELLWVLGPNGLSKFDALASAPERLDSQYFEKGGVAVLRSMNQYLYVDAGPVGLRGLGGHGHNDILSFEWHAHATPILTDSGAYVYTADADARNKFRSSDFHNSVMVDGNEVNRFWPNGSLWHLFADAEPINQSFFETAQEVHFGSAHTGYVRLDPPVTVRREFTLSQAKPEWTLHDFADGSGNRQLDFFFQLAPSLHGMLRSRGIDLFLEKTLVATIRSTCDDLRWEEIGGWFSPSYGVRIPRERWRATARVALPFACKWTLSALDSTLSK
jgi:hypothetical protein